MVFSQKFGPQLNIYQTTLSDTEHVHLSEALPNHFLHENGPSVPGIELAQEPQSPISTTITAVFNSQSAQVVSLVGRAKLVSPEYKKALTAGGQVSSTTQTP